MSDGRKTTSIARRIAWNFHWKKLFRILWQTVMLGMAAALGWCAAACQLRTGRIFPTEAPVFLSLVEDFTVTRELFLQELSGGQVFRRYIVMDMGSGRIAYMGDFVFWLCCVLAVILALRLLGWLLSGIGATGRIRRYLRPIDDIAQVTESISSHGFDESKFHSLEDAIDHINGGSADEQLHIGDDDLAGLETAVNNLIVRMHNAYRQQVRFVDDASHELRTPIAVIGGYADLLDRWGQKDEQVLKESIRAIKTETEHMKTLVEQLLFLARGDAGRQPMQKKRLDMTSLLREVWEESRMIDPAHEYVFQEGGPVYVQGDEAMLKQAIRILTDNAVKYSPEGSRITLRAYAEANEVCVDVQDNGIGVSREDAARMFDRFYRADAARNSETGGSGLGLSIARWIVERHGGSFRVLSYEEVGTRITIALPADRTVLQNI
ncbi:MAG: sensor histidine kinase [Oscillospiraceae bacterium]